MEVDESNVYWFEITLEEGAMVRAGPKDGTGPVRTLGQWSDFQHVRSLVVDGTHVYWLRREQSTALVRADKAGTSSVNLALPNGEDGGSLDLGPIYDAGDAVLVGEHGCRHVVRVPKDGGAPTLWNISGATPGGGATELETDGRYIYCFNLEFLHRLDTTTGAATILRSDLGGAGGPLLRIGRQLYVLNNPRNAGGTGALAVVDLDAPALRDLGSAHGYGVRLLYDEPRRALYWLTGLNVGSVIMYRLDDAAVPQPLFENQDVWGNSAADAEYIYWPSDRAVTRLKK